MAVKGMMDGKRWNFQDLAFVDDKMYFITDRKLCYTDISTWKTHYVFEMIGNTWLAGNAVPYMEALDDKLFLFGAKDMRIAVYDTVDCSLNQVYEETGKSFLIHSMFVYDNRIFLLLKNEDYFLTLDKNGDIQKVVLPICGIQDQLIATFDSKQILYCMKSGSRFWLLDPDIMEWKEKVLPFDLSDCISVRGHRGRLFFLDRCRIIVLNEDNSAQKIELKDNSIDTFGYNGIIGLKDKIFIIPRTEKDIYEVFDDGIIKTFMDYPDDFQYTRDDDWLSKWGKYYLSAHKDGIYYFARRATNYMLTIDEKEERIKWIGFKLPDLSEFYKYNGFDKDYVVREEQYDLEEFIDVIKGF